jgi:hypothetical protein
MSFKDLLRALVQSSHKRNELLEESNRSLRRMAHYIEQQDKIITEQNALLRRLERRVDEAELQQAVKEGRARILDG